MRYSFDGQLELEHVITRVSHADAVTDIVVATSTEPQNDVTEQYAPEFGEDVIRRNESDVLSRFERALKQYDPETVVRVTADCLLVFSRIIDASIRRITESNVEHVSASLERMFPVGRQ